MTFKKPKDYDEAIQDLKDLCEQQMEVMVPFPKCKVCGEIIEEGDICEDCFRDNRGGCYA